MSDRRAERLEVLPGLSPRAEIAGPHAAPGRLPPLRSHVPYSQQVVRTEVSQLLPSVDRTVCWQNAARIYRHSLPPAEMIAASEIRAATDVDAGTAPARPA